MSRSRIWGLLPVLADRVIAISDAVADSFQRGNWRPEVIYNPFDMPDPLPDRKAAGDALRASLGLAPDTLVVAFVGRLVSHKRADVCIRMLPEVIERTRRPVACVLIGRGSEAVEQSLRRLSQECGVAENVHFLGFRYPVDSYIAGCDLLVAPSEIEGFGRTLVESMLLGTPVLASNVASHFEIIRDGVTGRLVAAGDIAGFAASAACLLIDRNARLRLAEAARIDVASRFSTAAHVARISAVYDQLLRR